MRFCFFAILVGIWNAGRLRATRMRAAAAGATDRNPMDNAMHSLPDDDALK